MTQHELESVKIYRGFLPHELRLMIRESAQPPVRCADLEPWEKEWEKGADAAAASVAAVCAAALASHTLIAIALQRQADPR